MAVIEHPEWRKKFPTGPVHWDVWCDKCNKHVGLFPPHGHIHGKMWNGISFSPNDYGNLGIAERRNGQWLCKDCAPIIDFKSYRFGSA